MKHGVPRLSPMQAAVLLLTVIGVPQRRICQWLMLSVAAERTHYLRGMRKIARHIRGEPWGPPHPPPRGRYVPRMQRKHDLLLIPLDGG